MAGKNDTEKAVETIEAVEPAQKKTRTRTTKTAEPAEKKTRTRTTKAVEPAEKKTRTRTVKKEETVKTAEPVKEEAVSETKAAEPEVSVVIQYGSREITAKDVAAAAVNAYKAAHEGAEIHTVTAYVKPEENAVYYVVNGDDSEGSNKLDLF